MRKKKKVYIFITIALLLCIIIGASIIIYRARAYDLVVIPMQVQVGNHVGFSIGNNTVDFGTGPPGSRIERSVILTTEKKGLATIIIKGIDFVRSSEYSIALTPEESYSFTLVAAIPQDQAPGIYRGEVIVLTKIIK